MLSSKEFREKEKQYKRYEREKRKDLEYIYQVKIKRCKLLLVQNYYLIVDKDKNNIKHNKVFFDIDDVERYLKYKEKENSILKKIKK